MRKGIPPDDRLVVLHRERGRRRDELGGAREHRRLDAGPERQHVVAHLHRHHDLFERGVAGALADTVDGALDLPRARLHAGERIGDRHAEVVVAVRREARFVGIGHARAQHLDQREIFLRHRVADGVGDVDGGGAGIDGGLHAAAEEILLGAGCVFRRPLDVVGVAARARDLRDHHLEDLVRLFLELVFHVHRRGGDEGVDALALGRLDGLGAAVDVLERGAREAADHGILRALGDLVHGGEVAFRGDREAGLDDVDAHGVEELGDLELLLMRHGRAGTLLAVAQGGVEDDDAVLLGLCLGSHWLNSFSIRMRHVWALFKGLSRFPRVPRRICPAGPQGRIRRRSVPRMREAAAPALPAVRSIAQISWRVDMVLWSLLSLVSPVNLTDSGKARVNREAACSGKRARKSSAVSQEMAIGQKC